MPLCCILDVSALLMHGESCLSKRAGQTACLQVITNTMDVALAAVQQYCHHCAVLIHARLCLSHSATWLQVDLLHAPAAALKAFSRLSVDTVVTNPPFGTRQKGADVEFLNIALQVGQPLP